MGQAPTGLRDELHYRSPWRAAQSRSGGDAWPSRPASAKRPTSRFVLSDPVHKWELYDGRLREKPGMTWDHGRVAALLSYLLHLQLDPSQYQVAINDWRLRRSPDTVYIPDIVVVPTAFGQDLAVRPGTLAIFSQPLPLVIEFWSASTDDYDVDTKIPAYQRRGDAEIWRVHPVRAYANCLAIAV